MNSHTCLIEGTDETYLLFISLHSTKQNMELRQDFLRGIQRIKAAVTSISLEILEIVGLILVVRSYHYYCCPWCWCYCSCWCSCRGRGHCFVVVVVVVLDVIIVVAGGGDHDSDVGGGGHEVVSRWLWWCCRWW